MPRSPSPSRGSRERSRSPRRDRDRYDDRKDRYDDESRQRGRDRSLSPIRQSSGPRKVKELSFYKKSSMGSFSKTRDPLEVETEKERMQRRERGEVPARFGGTREHGVRNTMSTVAPQGTAPTGMGSLKRTIDPLDRISAKKGEDYKDDQPRYGSGGNGGGGGSRDGFERRDGDRQREERLKAMDKPQASTAAPTPQFGVRMIEVIANDRMGRKVRVKCLPTDTVGDLKRLIAAQTGTTAQKIQLKKWYTAFKDHVSLRDYEINDGMSLEMY